VPLAVPGLGDMRQPEGVVALGPPGADGTSPILVVGEGEAPARLTRALKLPRKDHVVHRSPRPRSRPRWPHADGGRSRRPHHLPPDMDRQQQSILQAHAFLAVAGTLLIMVIGDQIERAVAIIGVASVIRYRYSIRNPKDASTLIISLRAVLVLVAEVART